VSQTGPSSIASERALINLRAQRDRFVALAFCAADVLIELDPAEQIVFAAGTTSALLGCEPQMLYGRCFSEMLSERDQSLVGELIGQSNGHGRFEDVPVALKDSVPELPVSMTGYVLPELGEHCFLTLRLARPGDAASKALVGRDDHTGLYEPEAFARMVQEHLTATPKDSRVTVVELDQAGALRGRIQHREWYRLHRAICACLRAASMNGNSASQLGPDRYGLLHHPSVDIEAMKARIHAVSLQVDPRGEGLSAAAAELPVQVQGLDEAETAMALVYTIKRFAEIDQGLTLARITDDLPERMASTTRQMAETKRAVAEEAFRVAFQPVVSLGDRQTHHFEALIRPASAPVAMTPFEFVHFAEDVGLITELDLGMCRQVVARLRRLCRTEMVYPVAVNISGYSIDTPSFPDRLWEVLREAKDLNNLLLFEITESARIRDLERANRILQTLRKGGFRVCLDDFGAGEAAFDYLRAFEVDFVKIDRSYVNDARRDAKGKAFLSAMAALCHSLKVSTIAEGIEDVGLIPFLRDCGVELGQGFLFAEPRFDADLRRTSRPRKVVMNMARRPAAEGIA
jgi:EAL domain-containing protein (putative c-di-GMP-specific phosphodiesterase class I)